MMNTHKTADETISRDFQRDVWCLFGLPVDNLTMASTKALLRERVNQGGTSVLSTINLNWVVQSLSDDDFRTATLNSDLVVLDGKPLMWLAKLLGFPMRETVPGSTLIEELIEDKTDKPLTIFLFGGEGNAAEMAMSRINQRKGGLHAVGSLNPGFGTVEDMSTSDIIDAINSEQPDILLVALGANKGTKWIEQNRHRLNAKIISYLGATINFLAGTVKRAPRFMQRTGLEWVWRIVQEPNLFGRYAIDGSIIIRFILSRLPLWWCYRRRCRQFRLEQPDTDVRLKEGQDEILLSFGRNLQPTNNLQLRQVFSRCARSGKRIVLDFSQTKFVGSRFLGLLLIFLSRGCRLGCNIEFINIINIIPTFRLFGLFQSVMVDKNQKHVCSNQNKNSVSKFLYR